MRRRRGFSARGMATASVRNAGKFDRDQSKVWQKVAEDRADAGLCPVECDPVEEEEEEEVPEEEIIEEPIDTIEVNRSSSLCDVLEVDVDGYERLLTSVRAHFRGKAAIGFAYAINGRPVSVRTFAHPRLMRAHFDIFLRTAGLEPRSRKTTTPAPRPRRRPSCACTGRSAPRRKSSSKPPPPTPTATAAARPATAGRAT